MTTQNENTGLRIYSAPQIDKIELDNEISLSMESAPPVLPGETFNNVPDHFNNDPFKLG